MPPSSEPNPPPDLAALVAEVARTEAAYRAAVERRNEAMRDLYARDRKSHSMRKLALASGVSTQRVSQLIGGGRAAA